MATLDRALEIVGELEAAGFRATTDPAAVAAPCILVPPPDLTFDVGCGVTVEWHLVALAPAVQTADRTSWETLDTLVDGLADLFTIESGIVTPYVVNGRSYPSYTLTMREAI